MKNFIIKQKRILLYCLSFALSALFLISSIFVGSSTLVSADSNLSVKDVASKVKVESVSIIYFDSQTFDEDYIGSISNFFTISVDYFNPDYEYGYLYMIYDDYLKIKNDSYSCDDYVQKLEEMNLFYYCSKEDFVSHVNARYELYLNIHFTKKAELEQMEKTLAKEAICFVYVKDVSTGESALSAPSIFSFDGACETNPFFVHLKTENINLKNEIEELKKNSKNNNIDFTKIISIVGVALLGFGFLCFLIDSSKGKKNRK